MGTPPLPTLVSNPPTHPSPRQSPTPFRSRRFRSATPASSRLAFRALAHRREMARLSMLSSTKFFYVKAAKREKGRWKRKKGSADPVDVCVGRGGVEIVASPAGGFHSGRQAGRQAGRHTGQDRQDKDRTGDSWLGCPLSSGGERRRGGRDYGGGGGGGGDGGGRGALSFRTSGEGGGRGRESLSMLVCGGRRRSVAALGYLVRRRLLACLEGPLSPLARKMELLGLED